MHQRRLIADIAFEDNWPTSTKTAVTPAAVADDPQRTLVALINGWRVVKSFRYLLTDPCELNILLTSRLAGNRLQLNRQRGPRTGGGT